jgi:hypothetical protein
LTIGDQQLLEVGEPVLAWTRTSDDESKTVLVNFASEETTVSVQGTVVLSSDPGRVLGAFDGRLAADEAAVVVAARGTG